MKICALSLWRELSRSNRLLLLLVLVFICFSAVADLLVVGGVMPLVAISTSSEATAGHWMRYAFEMANVSDQSSEQAKELVSLAYLLIIVVALVAKMVSTFALFRFTHRVGTEYATGMFRRSMAASYEWHLNRSASDLISALTLKGNDIVQYYTSMLQIFVSVLNLAILVTFMLVVDSALAISVSVFIGSVYFLIFIWAKSRLASNGRIVATSASKFVGLAREGLAGYRDVLLEGLGNSYVHGFEVNHNAYMETLGRNSLIANVPKYFFDFAVYFVIILILNRMIPGGQDYLADLAIISAFALAMQRISPLAHTLYSSYSNVQGTSESIRDVFRILRENAPISRREVVFHDSIELTNVSYHYVGSEENVIKNMNLRLSRSEWLVIVGKSGSGKSTLLDIILGLLSPTSGEIYVNGERVEGGSFLFRNIGHVSQHVHVFEDTILFNITLSSVPDAATRKRATRCLEIVDLYSQIQRMPGGIEYRLGDDGAGLSGGQKQRLGIARALFKEPALLVLDEATSAIDEATADLVMKNIRNAFPGIACIRITHRGSDVQSSERVIRLTPSADDNFSSII